MDFKFTNRSILPCIIIFDSYLIPPSPFINFNSCVKPPLPSRLFEFSCSFSTINVVQKAEKGVTRISLEIVGLKVLDVLIITYKVYINQLYDLTFYVSRCILSRQALI